ncbi:unnamed protein product [Ascophyllum nodosum]
MRRMHLLRGVAWLALRQQCVAFVPSARTFVPTLSSAWEQCASPARQRDFPLDSRSARPRTTCSHRTDGALNILGPGSTCRRNESRRSLNRRGRRESSSRLRMSMIFDPGYVTSTLLAEGVDVSAWSVTSLTSDLAADLFQASLVPYLAFLFFLSRKETKTPDGGSFGFAFLLVFVVATIPAGILAKTQYDDILANVDYLHGIAESFLTITNLLIVGAFRKAVVSREQQSTEANEVVLRSAVVASAVAVAVASPLLLATVHTEPSNALSLPTWMVHVSSLIEWLAAMTYVWRFADVSGRKEWKGLTWGMLPLHTSGLIACTYHIFYNAPQLTNLVAMQAGLTCFGNATMAFATWRIWQAGKEAWTGDEAEEAAAVTSREGDSSSSSWREDLSFYGQIVGITVAGAALVKWGELLVDFPFNPSYAAAAVLILGPTALNAKKWWDRSADPSAPIEGII